MTTQELAKTFDRLARELRTASPEVLATVSAQLRLDERRWVGQGSGGLRAITVAEVSAALESATGAAGKRGRQLRSDVFERRVEKLRLTYTTELLALSKGGRVAPKGRRVAMGVIRREDISVWDCSFGGHYTEVAAVVGAWQSAAFYALTSIVPAYGYRELEKRAGGAEASYAKTSRLESRVTEAANLLLVLFCSLKDLPPDDSSRKRYAIEHVFGADPAPWEALANANTEDPCGVFKESVPVHLPATLSQVAVGHGS